MMKKSSKFKDETPPFLNIANFIIPWLTPKELTTLSYTCRTLSHLTKLTTTVRSSDASRSFESHPIPFINTVDSHPYAFFLYTRTHLISSSSPFNFSRQFWGFSENPNPNPNSQIDLSAEFGGNGCDCKEECGIEGGCGCCVLRCGGGAQVVTECGPSCGCESTSCLNRVTQKGVSVRLKIVRVDRKGWGLFADEFISSGEFVCEYAGELLTTQEARRRHQLYDELAKDSRFSSALLVVREYLPSRKACFRINIDATIIGNVARFINHSCDGGNLNTVLVRSSGAVVPRVCFFASRDIQAGEELSFSYGDIRLRSEGLPCFCGCPTCFGTLPSETT